MQNVLEWINLYVFSSILAYNLKRFNTIALTTFVTISAAIFSFPFMLYYEFYYRSFPSSISLIALLYLGIFPTAIAFLIRFLLIARAGPTFLSFVSYLIPGFSIIWGFIFLKETVPVNSIIGLFFVLLGIFINQKFSNVKKNWQKDK